MMSSSLGGLVGSRSKMTPALRKPPRERVRTGLRAALWVDGVEERRSRSGEGVDWGMAVVEERRGGGDVAKGA